MPKKPLPPSRPPKKERIKPPTKTFKVEKFQKNDSGEKVIIYGESGMGKTTLAALAPDPVFIAIDDGSRKIKDPNTGEDLNHIPGIETYSDIRSALQQSGLFDDYQTIVVDTGTELQTWAEKFVLENYKLPKGGTAHDLRAYGWGEGYAHLLDVMRFILQDLDKLVKYQGKHAVILCQNSSINKANPGGEDFIKEGPALYHDKRFSVRETYIAWADHVVKIDYGETFVDNKKVRGDTTRQIFVKPETYFVAKSRTLPHDIERITFDDPTDDSFWSYLLKGDKDE
jgi:hypothetical protein